MVNTLSVKPMKKNKRIYISGKISGLPYDEVIAKFEAAELILMEMGYDVFNPLKNGLTKESSWSQHMFLDLKELLKCDCIYLLPDALDSKGARLEIYRAYHYKKEFLSEIVSIEHFRIRIGRKRAYYSRKDITTFFESESWYEHLSEMAHHYYWSPLY